jgi:hypothetical protein
VARHEWAIRVLQRSCLSHHDQWFGAARECTFGDFGSNSARGSRRADLLS